MTQYVLDTFVGRGDLVLGAILCVALGVGGFGSFALGRGGALVVGAILGLAHGVGGFGSIAFVEGGVLVLGTNARIRPCFGADCRVAPPRFVVGTSACPIVAVAAGRRRCSLFW